MSPRSQMDQWPFKSEGDLERTLDDKVQVGPAVGAVEERGDVHSAEAEPNTGDTVHREHKQERGEEDRKNKREPEAARKELT